MAHRIQIVLLLIFQVFFQHLQFAIAFLKQYLLVKTQFIRTQIELHNAIEVQNYLANISTFGK